MCRGKICLASADAAAAPAEDGKDDGEADSEDGILGKLKKAISNMEECRHLVEEKDWLTDVCVGALSNLEQEIGNLEEKIDSKMSSYQEQNQDAGEEETDKHFTGLWEKAGEQLYAQKGKDLDVVLDRVRA